MANEKKLESTLKWINHYKGILIIGLIVLLGLYHFLSQEARGMDELNTFLLEESQIENQTLSEENLIEESDLAPIYVDLKGAVLYPDMYRLDPGSRVYDLIELAGGFRADAAVNHVNLASILEDQMLIYIYSQEEVEDLEENPPTFLSPGLGDEDEDGLININSANSTELEALPNIGPKKAQAIIQYRQENGSFVSKEDLMNVSGIGIKTFEQLESLISVGP